MNWPQPWCPLHAPKLLWSRLTKAKVGLQTRPKQAKVGRHRPERVIWKKNAALVTCSSLCACSHVIIHPPIKSQVSRERCCTRSVWASVSVSQLTVGNRRLCSAGFSGVGWTGLYSVSLNGCDPKCLSDFSRAQTERRKQEFPLFSQKVETWSKGKDAFKNTIRTVLGHKNKNIVIWSWFSALFQICHSWIIHFFRLNFDYWQEVVERVTSKLFSALN